MIMKLEMGGRILNVISAYAPQTGRSAACKESFWNELHEEVRKIPKDDMIWLGGDLNGHIGKNIAGYVGVSILHFFDSVKYFLDALASLEPTMSVCLCVC